MAKPVLSFIEEPPRTDADCRLQIAKQPCAAWHATPLDDRKQECSTLVGQRTQDWDHTSYSLPPSKLSSMLPAVSVIAIEEYSTVLQGEVNSVETWPHPEMEHTMALIDSPIQRRLIVRPQREPPSQRDELIQSLHTTGKNIITDCKSLHLRHRLSDFLLLLRAQLIVWAC